MDKDYKIFLKHILESIQYIEDYIKDISEDDFYNSMEKQDAIVRRLEIIGEATKNLPEDFKINTPRIPWQKIAGMRNNLIHEYFGVDKERVWGTIQRNIPELKKEIKLLLK